MVEVLMAAGRRPVNAGRPGTAGSLPAQTSAGSTRRGRDGGPERMSDRYIYAVAVEAFFLRAMAGRLEGDVRARLRDEGIALDEPLLSVYPAAVFHRGVALASSAAYPAVAPEEAQFLA